MIHFISLPHTETTADYCWCAYTMKQMQIGGILARGKWETTLYAGTRNEGTFNEHVEIVTDTDRGRWFKHLNWDRDVWDGFDPSAKWWQVMNARAIAAIHERIQPGDIIGILAGRCQQQIADAFPNHIVIEWACGYEGPIHWRSHICFESEAWRHYMYGRLGINDGRYYDVTINNSFNAEDFIQSDDTGSYLLYLGRMTPRKGLAVVGELAQRFPVITAGQGDLRVPGAQHRGLVRGKEKAELLAGAAAVVSATSYLEPGGGVALEAMLSGVPVISTPWGCHSETVKPGVSGWHCSTLAEFVSAAHRALDGDLDPITIRKWADQFTTDAVAPRYDQWLRRLEGLYKEGWYEGAGTA